jgi:hypothetical protein
MIFILFVEFLFCPVRGHTVAKHLKQMELNEPSLLRLSGEEGELSEMPLGNL